MSSKQCIQNKSFYEKNSLYVKSDSLKSSSPTDVGSGERSHSQLRDRDFTTRRLTDTTMMSEVINICSNITLVNTFILCDCIISVTFQICDIFSRWWRTGTRWRWRLSTETLQRQFSKSVSSWLETHVSSIVTSSLNLFHLLFFLAWNTCFINSEHMLLVSKSVSSHMQINASLEFSVILTKV